jgi:hypothetical protein
VGVPCTPLCGHSQSRCTTAIGFIGHDDHDVHEEMLGFGQYNSRNREPLFVPGGSVMRIFVPWKPVVLVWGLLSAMIFFGFVASSALQGKDPFAPSAIITQPPGMKAGAAQAGQQPKQSHKAARTPSQ